MRHTNLTSALRRDRNSHSEVLVGRQISLVVHRAERPVLQDVAHHLRGAVAIVVRAGLEADGDSHFRRASQGILVRFFVRELSVVGWDVQ